MRILILALALMLPSAVLDAHQHRNGNRGRQACANCQGCQQGKNCKGDCQGRGNCCGKNAANANTPAPTPAPK